MSAESDPPSRLQRSPTIDTGLARVAQEDRMKHQFFSALCKTSLLSPALALAMISPAFASNLHVGKDGVDDSHCGTTLYSPCLTIQYTIANRSVAGDVINIAPGRYKELVTVNKELTLKGPEWGEATIDGMQQGTVVTIAGTTAKLEYLTIRNGLVTATALGDYGGGIYNGGTLELYGVRVTGNNVTTAISGFTMPLAGGIMNDGALDMEWSTVEANSASGSCNLAGGIVDDYGTVTVTNSRIAQNTITPEECNGPGFLPEPSGYLELHGSTTANTSIFQKNTIVTVGSFTLNRSTLLDSDADGILTLGSLVVVNSTITGSASAGIEVEFPEGGTPTMDISNSTVAANLGAGVNFGPGGLASTMRNSILAGNGGPDCDGDFISGDYNLIQNFTECGSVEGGHDLTGVSPKLRKLGFYGGPTPTMDLLPGSPAINGGNPAGCDSSDGTPIRIDQRGFPRPSPRGGRCDIGAVEVQIFDRW